MCLAERLFLKISRGAQSFLFRVSTLFLWSRVVLTTADVLWGVHVHFKGGEVFANFGCEIKGPSPLSGCFWYLPLRTKNWNIPEISFGDIKGGLFASKQTKFPSKCTDIKMAYLHKKMPLKRVYCSAWSKLQVSSPRFGPKRNSKMPLNHPPTTHS